jgi:hypothetical protein
MEIPANKSNDFVLKKFLRQPLSKNPELARKQRRLLQMLAGEVIAEQPVISIPEIQYRQLTLMEEPDSSDPLEVWLAFLAQAEALPIDDEMREVLVELGRDGVQKKKEKNGRIH